MRYKSLPVSLRGPAPRQRGRSPANQPQRPNGLVDWLLTIGMILLLPALIIPILATTAQTATITVSGDAVPRGQLSVVGTKFPAHERLTFTWDGLEFGVPDRRADRTGSFAINLSVPSSADAGSHTLAVTRADRPGRWNTSRSHQVLAVAEVVVVVPPSADSMGAGDRLAGSVGPVPMDGAHPSESPASATVPPSPTVSPTIPLDAVEGVAGLPSEPTSAPTAAPVPAPTAAPIPAPTAAPIPPPTAAPIPPPSSSRATVFVADAETGDASQWCFVHSAVPTGVVTSPVRAGSYSYRSEVQDGAMIYDSERSEYSNGPAACNKHLFFPGSETWTAFSVYPADDYPSYSHWSLVAQWKEPWAGTPPQQVNLQNDRWSIVGADSISPRPRFEFGTLQRGAWQDFLVHHYWSSDPSVGFVEVYLNGQLVLPKTFTRTLENNNAVFLSVGQYRDLSPTTGTGVLFIDEVRVDVAVP